MLMASDLPFGLNVVASEAMPADAVALVQVVIGELRTRVDEQQQALVVEIPAALKMVVARNVGAT